MKLTAKFYEIEQGSEAWLNLRSQLFTASEGASWMIEEPKCKLTVDELKAELSDLGIPFIKSASKAVLEALIPDLSKFMGLSSVSEKARIALIRRKMAMFTTEGQLRAAEANRKLEFNFDIKRGNEIEPIARQVYSDEMGFEVVETGFLAHESCRFDAAGNPSHGFGCSPDGLIPDGDEWSHGLESKAPCPEKMMEWLDDGVLPSEHETQVHFSMAVSGLRRWDFIGYCPQLPPLIVTTLWSEKTDRCLAALKSLHANFLTYRAKLGKLGPVIVGEKMEVGV